MPKLILGACLLAFVSPAYAQNPETIVQWKKEKIAIFMQPGDVAQAIPRTQLPPEAEVIGHQGPLLNFRDPKTHETRWVNQNDVLTNSPKTANVIDSERPRKGKKCIQAVGTGFASSCQ